MCDARNRADRVTTRCESRRIDATTGVSSKMPRLRARYRGEAWAYFGGRSETPWIIDPWK